MSAVRGFYRFLLLDGHIKADPTNAAADSRPPRTAALYFFFVVNRKGTLTHAATGFESGAGVRAGSKRKLGRMSRTADVNRS